MDDPTARGLVADKVAIVSGVGPGLGRSIALALAREGAAVVLAARDRARLEAVVGEIESSGGRALAVPTDVTITAQTDRLIAGALEHFGTIDILVNNGHHQGDFTRLEDSDLDRWSDVFGVNLYGPMRLIQGVLPIMRDAGSGCIVNVNSGAVISSKPTLGAYSASKSALASITKTLALEVGRYGIHVNGIYVSSMVGDNIASWGATEADRLGITFDEWLAKKSADEFALEQMPMPEDVADAALFLVSPLARAVTGQMLSVNNGQWVEGAQ
jgi:NAD(P)-dependent dehydrogenase (short-subunit alcohol dehydrogenase family)